MRELFTGASRGFGFIEMPGKQHALAARRGVNGKALCGRSPSAHEARPKGRTRASR
jgi:RNA recognition motif-containing protein